MYDFIHKDTQIASAFSPALNKMKITLAIKSTNPAKLILTGTACHLRTAPSLLNQNLAHRTISNPIASTVLGPLTELIEILTRSTLSMITLLASSTHHMVTDLTLHLSALDPRTKHASKAAANKREKSAKTVIWGTTVLGKFASASLVNFL